MMMRDEAEVWEIGFVASVVHSTSRSDKEAAAVSQVWWLMWNWWQLELVSNFAHNSWRELGFAVDEELESVQANHGQINVYRNYRNKI